MFLILSVMLSGCKFVSPPVAASPQACTVLSFAMTANANPFLTRYVGDRVILSISSVSRLGCDEGCVLGWEVGALGRMVGCVEGCEVGCMFGLTRGLLAGARRGLHRGL